MFKSEEDQEKYIIDTYPEVTEHRVDESHWNLYCSTCNIVRGFQVIEMSEGRTRTDYHGRYKTDSSAPIAIYFRCPVCASYKQWVIFKIYFPEDSEKKLKARYKYFRVASLPSEGIEDLDEIPVDPPALRVAYKQAVRAMDANAHIAAAAMFRRALQIITRSILGAKPGNLAAELKSVIGRKINGVTITNDFAKVGYIVKEAGNQGAHPDSDPDLLDFTSQDAEDLQQIFMEIITDLFVIPEISRKSREDFLTRRKIQKQ